jgi:replicative DNA helicase
MPEPSRQPLKDKIPPHNDDAELATLGALLLDKDAYKSVQSLIRPDDFYNRANGRVYAAIERLYGAGGRAADILTVVEELTRTGELDDVGGKPYIASLTNAVPTTANIEYYAHTVQNCSLRRAIIAASAGMSQLAYDESQDTRDILDKVEQQIFKLATRGGTLEFRSAEDTVFKAVEIIDTLRRNKQGFTGVPSGFEDLDKLTNGFQKGEMIIIGARPSIGKTALALNMASYITVRKECPAAFFTLEMSDIALITRILASESKIDAGSLRTGFIQAKEFNTIVEAAERIAEAPLYTVDLPNMPLLDLRSVARRLCSEKKIEIIFIDYLQLISLDRRELAEYERISEISRSLKALARELEVPVVALSQVGRESEKAGQAPGLASLRGSGSIEQDADVVMLLHRDRKTKDENGNPLEYIDTELNLAKQRNGPIGEIKLRFKPSLAQFYNAE